ncbi:hypothetical protein [Accumulibacter sp.]|uniref:hypothetical protein n=1 Tax=Accumulibacter sp. TaxID=2053492 RepID=UPI0035B3EAE1
MLLHLFDTSLNQVVEEIPVGALHLNLHSQTLCVPGGALLVRICCPVQPTDIAMFGTSCSLQFRSQEAARAFAAATRQAVAEAMRLNDTMLD